MQGSIPSVGSHYIINHLKERNKIMITSIEELGQKISAEVDKYTLDLISIQIYFNGVPIPYHNWVHDCFTLESIIRTIMLLVAKGELCCDDIEICETYYNEADEETEHLIRIQSDGSLTEDFCTPILGVDVDLYSQLINTRR